MNKKQWFKRYRLRLAVVLSMHWLWLPANVLAEMEFYSISDNAVVMYDAPSLKADKLFIADRFLPVEVVVDVDGWAKVRDSSGSLAWVEKKVLSKQRYVVVTVPVASVYKVADTNSELVFQAEQNTVMEWLGAAVIGWVQVRHADGQTGYVRINQVWGS